MKMINVTPHNITVLRCDKLTAGECGGHNCKSCEFGKIENIENCGITISATIEEDFHSKKGNVELYTVNYVPNQLSKEQLYELEEELCYGSEGFVIVGSIITAQAFPERVCAMVPVPGFERVPPEEKLVRTDKFTVFKG